MVIEVKVRWSGGPPGVPSMLGRPLVQIAALQIFGLRSGDLYLGAIGPVHHIELGWNGP